MGRSTDLTELVNFLLFFCFCIRKMLDEFKVNIKKIEDTNYLRMNLHSISKDKRMKENPV